MKWKNFGELKIITYGREEQMIKKMDAKAIEGPKEYSSAEFQLTQPRILFQFKIRKNAVEPMFAIVKEGSKSLESLKEGEIIDMTYYSQDKSVPAERKETRVKYITNGNAVGFKGHYMIALDIDSGKKIDLNVA